MKRDISDDVSRPLGMSDWSIARRLSMEVRKGVTEPEDIRVLARRLRCQQAGHRRTKNECTRERLCVSRAFARLFVHSFGFTPKLACEYNH
jgi:AraC-like DNA-binding protein